MAKDDQHTQVGDRTFNQFIELFVVPEIKKRQETGDAPKPFNLRAAQIVFFPDGRKPQVRLNSEIRAVGQIKLKPGISKKVGDPIFAHEMEGLNKINLTKEDDPDCGYATIMCIGTRWLMAFDFRYNKGLSRKNIERAEQFYQSAQFSFDQANWAAFIDNLFSAAELAAKASLLSIPDPKFRKKATHKAIQIKYNRFADIGNADTQFCDALNKLSGLRPPARYLKGDISVSKDEGRELLATVKKMIEDAKSYVSLD